MSSLYECNTGKKIIVKGLVKESYWLPEFQIEQFFKKKTEAQCQGIKLQNQISLKSYFV